MKNKVLMCALLTGTFMASQVSADQLCGKESAALLLQKEPGLQRSSGEIDMMLLQTMLREESTTGSQHFLSVLNQEVSIGSSPEDALAIAFEQSICADFSAS